MVLAKAKVSLVVEDVMLTLEVAPTVGQVQVKAQVKAKVKIDKGNGSVPYG
jgi:hypothetical protein